MAKKPKLHEIVAIATGRKGQTTRLVTDIYHKLDKPELFDGLHKVYEPATTEGESLPPERKNPQLDVRTSIGEASREWADLFNLYMTLDTGNQLAKGAIELEDTSVLAENVPVPTLLFLEKQLADIKAFITRIPTPDPAETWEKDPNGGGLRTAPTKTARTKKSEKHIVVVQATTEHPAQVKSVTEDTIAGYWTTIKQTTKLPAVEKQAMLKRVSLLLDAVKKARERANAIEVEKNDKIGKALLGYVFGEFADLSGS